MKKKSFLYCIIIWFVVAIILSYLVLIESTEGFSKTIVPLFGLTLFYHNFVLLYIWTCILSILFVIIFPRLFTPIFLKIKNLIWRKYSDVYIELENQAFSLKLLMKRGIFVFLFILGLSATLLFFNLIDPYLFISKELANDVEKQGIHIYYSVDVYFGIMLFLFPFCIGIWSIGWALEDAGLIHYNLPKKESKKIFDIEPIHLRFTNIIKGYAGFSAILYYISAITYYLLNHPERIEVIIILSIIGLIIIIWMIPAYLVYWNLNKQFLTKKLKKIKRIEQMEYLD